jgi:hypothetical protein
MEELAPATKRSVTPLAGILPDVRRPTTPPLRGRRPPGRLTLVGRLARGGLSSRRFSPAFASAARLSLFDHPVKLQVLVTLRTPGGSSAGLRAARPGPSRPRTRYSWPQSPRAAERRSRRARAAFGAAGRLRRHGGFATVTPRWEANGKGADSRRPGLTVQRRSRSRSPGRWEGQDRVPMVNGSPGW